MIFFPEKMVNEPCLQTKVSLFKNDEINMYILLFPPYAGDKDRWDSGIVSMPQGHSEVIWLTEQLH